MMTHPRIHDGSRCELTNENEERAYKVRIPSSLIYSQRDCDEASTLQYRTRKEQIYPGHRMESRNPHWYQRMGIPKWETIPTEKGISLPLRCWEMLVSSPHFLHLVFSENRENKSHFGGNVNVTLQPNNICVNINIGFLRTNRTSSQLRRQSR